MTSTSLMREAGHLKLVLWDNPAGCNRARGGRGVLDYGRGWGGHMYTSGWFLSKNGKNHHNIVIAAAAAKSLQSCLTLCNPIDSSSPCSPVPGILQARALEWVAISFSNAWKWKVKVKSLIGVRLFPTPWTAAHQAPPSMGFSRQEYWSGLPLPSLQYCN